MPRGVCPKRHRRIHCNHPLPGKLAAASAAIGPGITQEIGGARQGKHRFPGRPFRVYERLKPGGCYVIVDHAAAAGAGTSEAQSLHRIEPASARAEVEAAGFVLDAESSMLANKDDAHSIKVFDPSIKGRTDRFAFRFVKP